MEDRNRPTQSASISWDWWIVSALLSGVLVRITGINGDLWLDEISSLNLVKNITSWQQIFSTIDSDNNHPLNSLQIYLVGQNHSSWVYRILPLIYSLSSLLLSCLLLKDAVLGEISRQARRLVLWALSLSFLLILYGTEARGYSGLILAILATIYLAEKRGPITIQRILLFLATVLFGVLSHYSFIQFFAALLVYHLFRIARRASQPQLYGKLILMDLPAVLLIAFLYFTRVQYVTKGSGNIGAEFDVIINALSLLIGGMELSAFDMSYGTFALIYALLSLALIVAAIVQRYKLADHLWFLFVLEIFIAPTASILFIDPRVFFVRYFLPAIIFALFAVLLFLGKLYDRKSRARFIALSIFGLIIIGNILLLQQFVRFNRGQYSRTLKIVAQQTRNSEITYGSDQPFRNTSMVEHYEEQAAAPKVFTYISDSSVCPEWYVRHSQDQGFSPEKELSYCQSTYVLKVKSDFVAESGWRWFWYQQQLGK